MMWLCRYQLRSSKSCEQLRLSCLWCVLTLVCNGIALSCLRTLRPSVLELSVVMWKFLKYNVTEDSVRDGAIVQMRQSEHDNVHLTLML
eukprot:862261-Karenia_brevis.AAC.1